MSAPCESCNGRGFHDVATDPRSIMLRRVCGECRGRGVLEPTPEPEPSPEGWSHSWEPGDQLPPGAY